MVPFDLLKKALSLYMRMCIHKALSGHEGMVSEREGAWLTEEVTGVLKWSRDVLLPAMSEIQ